MVMCVTDTPVEFYPSLGLYVKREDLSCPGGPNFSKTRGVYAHIVNRPEKTIGVLDTSHSQGGWAVARACAELGKRCVVFYPWYKKQTEVPPQQLAAEGLGARLLRLPAGRSAILYHKARTTLDEEYAGEAYMMPNALKLMESVKETAAEFERTTLPKGLESIVVSASSGTIAAGVMLGISRVDWPGLLIVHMGYSRSIAAVASYIENMAGVLAPPQYNVIDERYAYADKASMSFDPPFPCNHYYDRKALQWFLLRGKKYLGRTLLWNIG